MIGFYYLAGALGAAAVILTNLLLNKKLPAKLNIAL